MGFKMVDYEIIIKLSCVPTINDIVKMLEQLKIEYEKTWKQLIMSDRKIRKCVGTHVEFGDLKFVPMNNYAIKNDNLIYKGLPK